MDIVVATTLLLFLSPVFLVLALVMRVMDPGPIFFGHERVGRGGRSFKCLKFRSMIVNSAQVLEKVLAENPAAREEWLATQKLRNDPRITGVGRFMRETSLDELPQLINVLRGDMSLVGPRPIVTAERVRYAGDIAVYEEARPGITGLWQVSGRSDCSYERRVMLDVHYVRQWSFGMDIKILFKTVAVVLKKEGSC
ncbi:sugar transferase [Aurantimonas sp. Leaf443]|uniref:sugar transferase n=1 Tax=Aurantimonas sp. Leaf443 TaxID=1736378 RepID=UPI0006F1F732|nr:sugar transferase [Aurantimonas sp. Leaf443]KQT86583.1 hypothetical protein ASG48_17695 [Aurantimonas sp. Leaf443]